MLKVESWDNGGNMEFNVFSSLKAYQTQSGVYKVEDTWRIITQEAGCHTEERELSLRCQTPVNFMKRKGTQLPHLTTGLFSDSILWVNVGETWFVFKWVKGATSQQKWPLITVS